MTLKDSRETILLADDEENVKSVFLSSLKNTGIRRNDCEVSPNVFDALKKINRRRFTLDQ